MYEYTVSVHITLMIVCTRCTCVYTHKKHVCTRLHLWVHLTEHISAPIHLYTSKHVCILESACTERACTHLWGFIQSMCTHLHSSIYVTFVYTCAFVSTCPYNMQMHLHTCVCVYTQLYTSGCSNRTCAHTCILVSTHTEHVNTCICEYICMERAQVHSEYPWLYSSSRDSYTPVGHIGALICVLRVKYFYLVHSADHTVIKFLG